MQTCELAELSGLVAANGSRFVRGRGRLSESGLRQYWITSKSRFHRWMQALLGQTSEKPSATPSRTPGIAKLVPVMEEIFASELLTRVWTALVCQYDRQHLASCGAPVVWNVFRCHEVARHIALQLLCQTPESERQLGLAVDKLRRNAERWTDLLLALLVSNGEADAAAVAFDTVRLHEFARDLDDLRRIKHGVQAWQLFQTSIKAAFQTGLCRATPNETLNSQIAASILTCFPPDLFDATGPLQSLWQERLQHTTTDMLAMVQDLIAAGDR